MSDLLTIAVQGVAALGDAGAAGGRVDIEWTFIPPTENEPARSYVTASRSVTAELR